VTPIGGWENFYVIVGSSAAALTGLQFVVMALVADLPQRRSARTIDAFATPTMIHFGAVLLLSAILSAPWRTVAVPMLLCTLCGGSGLVYVIIVARQTRAQNDYTPVFEDWLFHVWLPAAAYLVVAAALYVARTYAAEAALFGIATAAFLLLVIGIHNAWDTVTYLVVTRGEQPPNPP